MHARASLLRGRHGGDLMQRLRRSRKAPRKNRGALRYMSINLLGSLGGNY